MSPKRLTNPVITVSAAPPPDPVMEPPEGGGGEGVRTSRHSIAVPQEATPRRRASFLNLHIPDAGTNWRGSLTHLHLPTFTLTSPDGEQARKFTFGLGLRRHSHNVSCRGRVLCFIIIIFLFWWPFLFVVYIIGDLVLWF